MTNRDVVRAMFEAYRAQDLEAATALMADDFSFTSPQDDHLDKTTYLTRCFPTADRFASQDIVHLAELDDDAVVLMYRYQLVDGGCYQNAEVSTVRDGRLTEVQVFFGGQV